MKKNNCELCRQRKTKCDREDPCSNCKKAGLDCVFVSRPKLPRGRNGGRRSASDDLKARLRKLEDMITNGATAKRPGGTTAKPESTQLAQQTESLPPQDSPELEQYLGGAFWNSLASEVHDLRGLLQDSQDELDDAEDGNPSYDTCHKTTSSSGRKNSVDQPPQNHFNFVLTGPESFFVTPGLLVHPPQSAINEMCTSFLIHVDPILKFVHAPSLRFYLEDHGSYMSYTQGHTGMEALTYAIYYATVTAESPDFTARVLGTDKKQALTRYRFCTEVALSKANFLDARDLVTLQALVIYTTILRVQELGKQQYSLAGVVVQLARSFNLHRSSGYQNMSPFEAEMRRRLWSNIRLLDFYTALDRGAEPLILEDPTGDAPKPLNINDEDFGPNSTKLPLAQSGITNSSYLLLCIQTLSHVKRMNYHATTVHPPASKADWDLRLSFAKDFENMCYDKLYPYLDTSKPYHQYIFHSTRETIGVTKLFALRPLRKYPGATAPPVDNSHILELSLSILKESMILCETPGSPHTWWLWLLWFALAVALAELCVRPDAGDDVWELAEKTFFHYENRIADGSNGQLWQPIKRLRKRALSRRTLQHGSTSSPSSTPAICASSVTGSSNLSSIYTSTNPSLYIPTGPQTQLPLQALPQTRNAELSFQPDMSMLAASQMALSSTDNVVDTNPYLDMNDISWNSWNVFVDDFMNFDQPY